MRPRLVRGAASGRLLCLAVLASFLLAARGAAAGGGEGDEAWRRLDRELVELRGALTREAPSEVRVGGTLKYRYLYSDDLVYTLDPTTFVPKGDLSGVELQTLSFKVKGEVGGMDYKVSFNPARNRLRSTYVRFRPVDWMRVTFGRFKAPLLRSRLVSTSKLLFPERTLQARVTGPRDSGIKVEVDLGDRVKWIGALQNGDDGTQKERLAITRLEWEALGGGVEKVEGSYGAGGGPRLTLAAGASDDSLLVDGRVLAADLAFTASRLSVSGELLRHGDAYGNYEKGLIDPVSILRRGGTRPWGASIGFMVIEEKLELASRWEFLRDDNDTERFTASVNWYHAGHAAKWQASWSQVSSDNHLLESDVLSFGYVVSF